MLREMKELAGKTWLVRAQGRVHQPDMDRKANGPPPPAALLRVVAWCRPGSAFGAN